MFKKILIANRGEIARRVIHAAKEMGIATVAVYSDPDSDSLPVQEAEEAYSLEGVEAQETYLDISKIIAIAKKAKADAIHPGYGFLSENAEFAEACAKAKIKFVGPSPKILKLLGSKIESKKLAQKAKVATVPGTDNLVGARCNVPLLAKKIGYPLLIKASAGGGGKGMRIAHQPNELEEMIQGAEREALAFFKDKTLFLEKYFENPKHIEVQILGDEKGNLVHLFERECSLQRRHQKMLEETPSPSLTPKLRKEICDAALRIAKAANYSSAGTVEFLLDQKGNFYFLEVNTRLQVEHPITEMVTGIDLVKAQIRIAAGEKLNVTQDQIFQKGHAMECRLYAEDPENDFLPSEGIVGVLEEPQGPGVRIDSALEEGKPILPFYDPMLAKLIVWAETRTDASQKMKTLLQDYVLLGVRHNLDFLRFAIGSKTFQNGDYHTHSVTKLLEEFKKSEKENEKLAAEIVTKLNLGRGESCRAHTWDNQDRAQQAAPLQNFRNA